MKRLLKYNRFKDFWINCRDNNILSLLITKDESYRIMPAMNDYYYNISGRTNYFRALAVYRPYEYYCNLDKVHKNDFYLNRKDCIKELKRFIDSDRYVSILVDLYYWRERAYQWHIEHTFHFSLAIGYDDEKGVFYFDDGDVDDHELLIVPYSLLETAIVVENEKISAFELKVSDHLENYHYNTTQIRNNTNRIVKNLSDLTFSSHWSIYGDASRYGIMMYYSQGVIHRQIANSYFFDYLLKNDMISESDQKEIEIEQNKLITNWKNLKKCFIKGFHSKKEMDLRFYNDNSLKYIMREKNMWLDLSKMLPKQKIVQDINAQDIKTQQSLSQVTLKNIKTIGYSNREEVFARIILNYNGVKGNLHKVKEGNPFIIQARSRDSFEFLPDFVEKINIQQNSILIDTNIRYIDMNGIETFLISYLDNEYFFDDMQNKIPSFHRMEIKNHRNYTNYINRIKFCAIENESFDVNTFIRKNINKYGFKEIVTDTCYFSRALEPEKRYCYRFSYQSDKKNNQIMLHISNNNPFFIWQNDAYLGSFPMNTDLVENSDISIPLLNGTKRNTITVLFDNMVYDNKVLFRLEIMSDGNVTFENTPEDILCDKSNELL